VLFIAAPLTEYLIVQNKVTYKEFWNGYEVEAIKEVTECERDGDCNETYSCDPYIVMVPYTYTDSDGNTHTKVRAETRYHQCPYLQREYTYKIKTTLGTTDMRGTFADHTRAAWRDGEDVPSHIQTGPPQEWVHAKDRIAAKENGGVTEVHDYENYVLASDKTLLNAYSADIEQYTKQSLLRPHTVSYDNPIYGLYDADKFQAVNFTTNSKEWNEYLQRLNGYFGKQLQGNIHMLAVNANDIKDIDRYSQALFAYWKSPELDKYALSKNSIGIVMGVKDNKIQWARATGGLPVGNEGLLDDIRNNLRDQPFEPAKIIGIPNGDGKAFKPGDGVLAKTLWGEHKFQRPCMECIEEQQDGYNYLKSDIFVTGGQKFWIVFVATLFSVAVWAAFLYYDDRFSY
jgi:hypothetical protein